MKPTRSSSDLPKLGVSAALRLQFTRTTVASALGLHPHSPPTPISAWFSRSVCSCVPRLFYLVSPRSRFVCCHAILFSYHLDCHVWLESSVLTVKIQNARQSRDPLLIRPSVSVSFFPSLSVAISVFSSSPLGVCLFVSLPFGGRHGFCLPLLSASFLSSFVSGVCSVFPFLGACSGLSSVSAPSSFFFFHLALEHCMCAQ